MLTNDFPLISIVLPVYNRGRFIEQALDSILAESYPNKEIVIIDDGSTDDSKHVIEQWEQRNKDKIAIQFLSRPNKGFIKTLNELIRLSKGEYLVFFGSDDYLKNDGILKRFQYLRQNPKKLMVVADCTLVDEKDTIIHPSAWVHIGNAEKSLLKTDAGMRKYMILNGYVPGATLMADRRVFDKFGLYDERFCAEDWVYYIRIVAKDLLGFMDTVVAGYRMHGQNMSLTTMQLKYSTEQVRLTFNVFAQFYGMDKVYLIQKLVFSSVYIPYLWLKFQLIEQSRRAPIYTTVLNGLVFIKQHFMQIVGSMYARNYRLPS